MEYYQCRKSVRVKDFVYKTKVRRYNKLSTKTEKGETMKKQARAEKFRQMTVQELIDQGFQVTLNMNDCQDAYEEASKYFEAPEIELDESYDTTVSWARINTEWPLSIYFFYGQPVEPLEVIDERD